MAAKFAKVNAKTRSYEFYIGLSGHLIFAVLTGMAAWFWQERTLILDAAFQSYQFIADGSPVVMVERFGAASVQLLPLAAIWAGASLSTVLLLYSVSIVLFHWGFYCICLYGLKDKKAALAILIFNLLFVSDSFYWMQNELLQAITLMFVLWAVWMRRVDWMRLTRRDWAVVALLTATVAYYHPLVFFPLVFVWCWLWLHPRRLLSRQTLLLIAVLFALVFSSKYILRQPNFYDRGMTGQYVREFSFSFEKLLQSNSLRDFVGHLDDNFVLLLPLLILVTGFYLWKRQWATAALAPGATLLYCLLIMQRFLSDDRWYIQESHYQALAVFLIVPMVWDIAPFLAERIRNKPKALKSLVPILAALLLMARLTGIWNTHEPYATRLAYVREILEKTKTAAGRKSVVSESQANRRILLMYWGLPFETLQISALESPDSVRVVAIAANADSLAARLPRDSMVTFLMFPPRAFRDWPQQFYRMPDTTSYKSIRL